MIAMFAMAALAVDFSMMLGRRAEAQRAADAAALAGASAYKDYPVPTDARDSARARAIRYAAANWMGGDLIDVDSSGGGGTTVDGSDWTIQTREAFIQITPGTYRVRVVIRREGMGTWFARILGRAVVGVAADATAEVVDAGNSGPCVMPFGIPDIWHDANQDPNGNHIQDGAEQWGFEPGTDYYEPYDPDSPTSTQTGYGSTWRDNQPPGILNDYGRQILLKPQSPQDVLGPSNFNLWSFNEDSSAGRGGEGGIFDRVLNCDGRSIEFGNPDLYSVAPGNSVSLKAPIQELINRDRDAYWDGTAVAGSSSDDWRSSPRVIKIAMYEPSQTTTLGNRQPIIFNNVAMFFLEGFQKGKGPDAQSNIVGRFLFYADGGAGPNVGPLVKQLRLVQ
jgi:Flp pilus assembly protein TadG